MVMRTSAFLLACWLGFWSLPAGAHEDPSDQVSRHSQSLLERPQDPDLHLRRGELYRLAGQWDEAATDFRSALAGGADAAVVALCLAGLELDRGEPQAALDALEPLTDPDSAAWLIRGRALRQLARLPEAVLALSTAIARSARPGPGDYLELSAVIADQGASFIPEALAVLDAGSVRLGPVAALTHAAVQLEIERGRFAAALDRLEAAPPALRQAPAWLARRGEILRQAGRELEAQAAFTESLARIGDMPPNRRSTPAMRELESRLRGNLGADTTLEPGARP